MQAIGIARQSHGDGASVEEQTARIREHAKREGWDLVDVLAEQDVSGGRPLNKRPGLLAAVEAVEAGHAEIIVVAYFDRLVRSLRVQGEVVERVEAAGGRILTLDVGEVSSATAASWLSASFLGTVAEYHRRATSERVKAAHAQRRAKGQWNGGRIPFYRAVNADGVVTFREGMEEIVREAFELRASGRSVAEVLAVIREQTGLPLKSLNIAQRMLRDDSLVTEGIVPGATFRRCQTLVTKRGKRPQSDRLLARLGVLRCSVCGGSMNVHGSEGPTQVYRCHRGTKDEPHVAISVKIAEHAVAHAVRKALRDRKGSTGVDVDEISASVERKRGEIAGLVAVLDPSIPGAVERMESEREELARLEDELQAARDAAGFSLSPSLDWPTMTREGRRDLIKALVVEARVLPVAAVGTKRIEDGTDPDGKPILISPRVAVTIRGDENVQSILDTEAREMREELAEVLAREPVTLDELREEAREARS